MEQVSLSNDYIRSNFFGLSYVGQIKLFKLYMSDLNDDEVCFFNNVFGKYISIIEKFVEFKSLFFSYDNEVKSDLRKIVYNNKLRTNLNNNNIGLDNNYYIDCDEMLNNSLYFPELILDYDVEKYIYDFFSFSKQKRAKIALDLANYYSIIKDFNFKQLLSLCESNKDFFNNEIRKLSKDFYSLYLSLNTIKRMTFIWCLSYFNTCEVDDIRRETNECLKRFSGDREFVNPSWVNNKKIFEKKKILYKYFTID